MRLRPNNFTSFLTALALTAGASFAAAADDKSDQDINTFIKWKECRQDTECALVTGVCGGIDAVNTASVKRYRGYVKRTAPVVVCAGPSREKMSDYRARCAETRCQAAR